MSRAGDSSIAGVAALVLAAGACHPAPVIYQPTAPATSSADPAATEVGPGTTGTTGTTGTRDAPASAPGSTATGAPPGAAPANSEADEHLIASVRRAVADKVPPDELVAMVGKKPTVNTRAGLSIAVLRRVALVPDEAHGGERLDLVSAESVIYWARPVDSLDPHFVGIQFRKDGTRAVFFAVLLPP